MKRRRSDSLAEHVANSFLSKELNEGIEHHAPYSGPEIRALAAEDAPSITYAGTAALLERIRRDPELRQRLLAYLYNGDAPERLCRRCFRIIPRTPPGKRGRKRKYCDAECRYLANHYGTEKL
ncbi:hypothetical protein [Nocardia neocaledoniensis]|uniref:hypothetical protein n=1 Tax=Nocardia neocaledoniensis TaxID=236511 RepID=UPI002453DD62|nr:hypothetical protein [Nocardia neocaledoniensis]